MKQKRTHVISMIDRSGSMSGLEQDTIQGFNALLKKQRKGEGEVVMTTILFNHELKVLHKNCPIDCIAPLSESDYEVGGTTALLDAIGFGIDSIIDLQRCSEKRADHILVVITTDGEENSSHYFRFKEIKDLISRQQSLYGWEFIFLGANIDAIAAAKSLGIKEEHACNYHADHKGTQVTYEAISDSVSHIRAQAKLGKQWKQNVEADHMLRKG